MKKIYAAHLGLRPGNDPALTQRLNLALEQLKGQTNLTVCFEPGEYHFYPQQADSRKLCISNHEECTEKAIAFLLDGFDGLTVDGGGSQFVFHTEILPVYVTNSRNIKLQNFSVDYARPVYSEADIVSVEPQRMVLQIDTERYPWQVRQGRLWFQGENFSHPLTHWLEMDAASGAPAWGTQDLHFFSNPDTHAVEGVARALAPNRVEMVLQGQGRFYEGSRPGNRIILRHHPRSHPALYVTDSTDVTCCDVTVHHAAGMGFIAERCINLHLCRFKVVPNPKNPRCFTTAADATHFVSCGGKIHLEHCVFEKQLDDGVNVHGFYAPVHKRLDDTHLLLGWGHFMQVGVPLGRPGDEVSIMASNQLKSVWQGRLKSISVEGTQQWGVEFDSPLPDHLPDQPVLENLTLSPQVLIEHCSFCKNRARGILLTCKKALVQHCLFETAGASVYMEGEACYWYESGATQSIQLKNNRFANCSYIPAWGQAPITVCPKVGTTPGWFYHTQLRLEGNAFECFDNRLLFLRHVGRVELINNQMQQTAVYPPQTGQRFDLEHCGSLLENQEGQALPYKPQ